VQDEKPGTIVLVARAESQNYGTPNITYSMTHSKGGPDFRIDPKTGVVMTNTTLDYLRDNIYVVRRLLPIQFYFVSK